MSYKIVMDSCGELLDNWKEDPHFESVPLTLTVGADHILDDETFDQKLFLEKVAACPVCPKSACPSPERFVKAYDCDAEHVYAVTLSAELSGSYNSAVLGKDLFLEDHPDRKVYVFNSKSAASGMTLTAMKIQECENQGLSFEETVEIVERYIASMNTYFVLDNLDTLRKNGRLSGVKAMIAGALKIKPVMGSTDEGSICQLDQARGMKRALVKMMEHIAANTPDPHQRIVMITHCNAKENAMMFQEALEEKMHPKKILMLDTRGVSSMYANDGGIIVAV